MRPPAPSPTPPPGPLTQHPVPSAHNPTLLHPHSTGYLWPPPRNTPPPPAPSPPCRTRPTAPGPPARLHPPEQLHPTPPPAAVRPQLPVPVPGLQGLHRQGGAKAGQPSAHPRLNHLQVAPLVSAWCPGQLAQRSSGVGAVVGAAASTTPSPTSGATGERPRTPTSLPQRYSGVPSQPMASPPPPSLLHPTASAAVHRCRGSARM